MSNIINTVEETFNGYWNGNGNNATEMDALYPDETLAPQTCLDNMEHSVNLFWNMVYSMLALLMFTILMPYGFFCCWSRPRCLAAFYNVMGLVNLIIGSLLASVLKPVCPLECGKFVCSMHKVNPGPVYGCIVIFIALLWFCKACSLYRQARRQEVEQEAERVKTSMVETTTTQSSATNHFDIV